MKREIASRRKPEEENNANDAKRKQEITAKSIRDAFCRWRGGKTFDEKITAGKTKRSHVAKQERHQWEVNTGVLAAWK